MLICSCCIASYPSLDNKVRFTDNQWQAKVISKSLKKQVNKRGILEQYNAEYKSILKRKVIRKITPQELAVWKEGGNDVCYISHHPVLILDKVTTKCRIETNLSLKNNRNGPSPNSNWP